MKIFLIYNGKTYPWQIKESQTIDDLKKEIRGRFQLDPQQNIKLWHGGANLSGPWIIPDIGIPYGSTIHCKLKEQDPIPNLHITCNYNGHNIDLYDIDVAQTTIFELQETVVKETGLPLGSFRLTDAAGRELFPQRTCTDYGVLPGNRLHVQVWSGWSSLINSAVEGNHGAVRSLLDTDKAISLYQMRVVTFIAAHHGHLEMAEDMLNGGVKADESVGYHPGKRWCSNRDDPTFRQYAAHKAIEQGRLEILRLFMSRFPCCILVQNYRGQDALEIATEFDRTDCVTHISTKLSKAAAMVPDLLNTAPEDEEEAIYKNYLLAAKVKHWHGLGKDKIALFSKRTTTGNINVRALENKKTRILPTKSEKAMHVDGLIHFRCRTCPAKLAGRPESSLSDRKGPSDRNWTPSAKSRQMKKEVLTRGLQWDCGQQKSAKVEFTDLLFTPRVTCPLPNLSQKNSVMTNGHKVTAVAKDRTNGGQTASPRKKQQKTMSSESSGSRKSRTLKGPAIEDRATSLWVHNGLTPREKANACMDMSDSYSNKTWMSKFRIAMSVNESTLKRKLKEGIPKLPITRNEQGRLYTEQLSRPPPRTKTSTFSENWANQVETSEAVSRGQSRAFRERGSALVKEQRTSATVK